MTTRPRLKPFPSKPTDWEYLARNRRAALAGIDAAAERLLRAKTDHDRRLARRNMRTFQVRLAALGVTGEDAP